MKALERNTSLRMLNMRGNGLSSVVAGDVAEMLLEVGQYRLTLWNPC